MEKELFTIHPLEGFGLLQFRQSVASAKSFASIYGEITGDGPMYNEEAWERAAKLFREMGRSEEEIAKTKELYRETRIDGYMFSFARHIVLVFYEDQLLEIRILKDNFPAYLGDQDLFSLAGESAARYVAEHVRENPYMWERGMFFVNHSLVMDKYFEEIENGEIKWTGPSVRPYDRAIFLTPPAGELVGPYAFDPSETPIYKVIE